MLLLTEAKERIAQGELELIEQTDFYQAHVDHLLGAIPTDANLNDLLQVLSVVAGEAGVDVTAVRPQASGEGRLSHVQELMVELECDFPALCQFLSKIDQRPEWLWGVELVVQCTGKPATNGQGELLLARVYLQQPHHLKSAWRNFVTQCQQVGDSILQSRQKG